MRSSPLVLAASLLAASAAPPALAAEAEDGYRHGRVRYVEPGVTLHRATEVSAEEALANVPFLPGDRVWTDGSGRAEFQFPDGTLVRLDSASKLDYAGHEEGQSERLVLRLWSGSLIVRVRTPQAAHFEVETPAGSIALLEQAMLRVDVDSGQTRISVYRGEAVLDDGRERVRLAAGERTHARWGGAAAPPESFDIDPEDDFARWDDARESEERWAARSSEYLPAELDPYAGELERNGNWRYEASMGYVWTPHVAAGWSPYSSGHWSWTPYGWTWIPYETWGWAPSHYGRWGFAASFGWYWAPGSVWGPGWVSWGVGHGYVGWCALGWRDKPALPWHGSFNRGFAVPRGGRGNHGGWNVVREGDFGHRDVARRGVPLAGIDPQALRIAESPSLRPSRDGRALLASNPSVRAISRRPTPGDFVRELAVDNKTTIPSPWLRSGEARVQPDTRRSREQSATARRRAPEGSVAARPGAESAATAETRERSQSRPRTSRAVPWYAPRSESGAAAAAPAASNERGTRTRETQPRETQPRDTQAYRRTEPARPRGETQSQESEPRSYRARPDRTETVPRPDSDGQARHRSSAPRRDEGSSYRPQAPRTEPPARDDSRAEQPSAPRSESSSSRSSRGDGGSRSDQGSGGGGGTRSAPRPPRQRN